MFNVCGCLFFLYFCYFVTDKFIILVPVNILPADESDDVGRVSGTFAFCYLLLFSIYSALSCY